MSAGGKAAGGTARAKRMRRLGIWATVFIGVFITLLIAVPATFVVIAVGMLPSVVALFVDGRRGPYAFYCTASLNLAGIVPVIGMLWAEGNGFAAAMGILQDPYTWALMYSGAGFAMFLLWLVPIVMRALSDSGAWQSRRQMERARRHLVKEWGNAVVKDAAALGGAAAQHPPRAGAKSEAVGPEGFKSAG